MRRLLLIIIFLTAFLFTLTQPSSAATIFSDPLSGTFNSSYWLLNPSNHSATPPLPSSYGIQNLGDNDYISNVAIQNDVIIKWDSKINNLPSFQLLNCRYDPSVSNGLDIVWQTDGTARVRSFINGGGHEGPLFNWNISSGEHHFEFSCIGSIVKVKEDNNILYDSTSDQAWPTFTSTHIRFDIQAGNSEYKNFYLCDSSDCSSSSSISLSVPLLKQTDPLWSSMEYDSATKWAPTNPTIGDWGCALTSATMVMQYYGLTKMPDGTPLNPASVNKWLKSQKNGYVGNGLFNWLAITTLTKLAKNQNPNFNYDALQYRRQENFSSAVLDTDLHNNQPDILGEPGHFIVGKGEDNTIFSINDPFYNRTSLSSYNNTALSMGRYIPSNTNLSYIQIVLPPTVNAVLQNSNGQKEGSDGTQTFSEITDGDYYIEGGLNDPITNTTGSAARFLIVPTPQDGNYSLTFYSTTTQSLNTQIFTYDVDGNVIEQDLTGMITPHTSKTMSFSYQQEPSTNKADKLCQIFQQHIPNQQVSDFLCSLIGTKMQ